MQIPNAKQLLCMLLVVLIAYPASIGAAPAATAVPRAVLGSINAYGTVRVGDVAVPAQGTLFAGDQVRTELGGAVVQYQQGARVRLGSESVATFSPSQVQLQKGQMSFQARAADGPVFAASTLMLKPAAPNSAANVVLEDRRASVAVTEGILSVVDPSGVELASLSAGEARLFEEASAALPPAPGAPSPAPPQLTGDTGWVLALAVGVVGASLGIAGLVRANSANDRADEATALATQTQTQAAQLQTLITTLQSQNAALQTQVRSLSTQLVSISQAAAAQGVVLQQLSVAIAEVTSLQSQLSDLQIQINAAAAAGNTALLNTLLAQQATLFARVRTATALVGTLTTQLGNIRIPVASPV